MELKRVVITGLGAVTPIGKSVPETWKAALEGVSGAAPITLFDASKHKTHFACEVKDLDISQYIDRKENLSRIPKDLPVLFIAGGMDPVGNFGEGVKRVCAQMKNLGLKDVTCKLYEGDRHEILNELDHDVVDDDILSWLNQKMP